MTDADVMQPEEGAALAAEYVLGLLSADEVQAAEARMAAEPAFAREVAAWWDRLAPLLEEEPGRAPRTNLWPRIEAALQDRKPAVAAPAPVDEPAAKRTTGPTPGAPAQFAPPAPRRDRGDGRDAQRRGGAGRLVAAALAGAIAASVATVGVMVYRDRVAAPAEQPAGESGVMVATLNPEAGEALYVATFDRERRRMIVAPTRVLPAGEGRVEELWIIPAGGAPVPAGVLQPGPNTMELEGDLLRLAQAGATLAVSLEPPGGSPTGQPTGPVIATGALTVIG